MLDLHRYLVNPFGDPRISRAELNAFTADFLGRIVGQNPGGRYDDTIAAVSALHEQLEGTLADEVTASAVQKARTAATLAKRDLIRAALSALEGLVHARLVRGEPAYLEVFPSGLEEFRLAPLDGLNPKLLSLLDRLAPHAATIGAADIAKITTLQGEWATLRGEQVAKKGSATTAEETRRAAMDALRLALFDALLVIAREEKGQPERLSLYLTQSLLEDAPSTDDESPAPPAPPAPL